MSSTFTGLSDDTVFNITVYGMERNQDVLSLDFTSVRTIEFEGTYVHTYVSMLVVAYII